MGTEAFLGRQATSRSAAQHELTIDLVLRLALEKGKQAKLTNANEAPGEATYYSPAPCQFPSIVRCRTRALPPSRSTRRLSQRHKVGSLRFRGDRSKLGRSVRRVQRRSRGRRMLAAVVYSQCLNGASCLARVTEDVLRPSFTVPQAWWLCCSQRQ